MKSRKHLDSHGRSDAGRNAELLQAADKLSSFQRISWKEALGKIVSPAFRLHRYRNAHNRLLQDALCELDTPGTGGCGA